MKLRNCSEERYKLDVLLLGSYLGGHWCIYHQLDNPKHELELWLNVIEQPGTPTITRKTDHFGPLDVELILRTLSCPPVRPRPCMRQSVRQVALRNMGPMQIHLNLNIVEIKLQRFWGTTMWETNLYSVFTYLIAFFLAHCVINFACCEP